MESRKKIDSLERDAQAYSKAELVRRPGFLIRRLHQIHLAFFAEECAAFETTPLQSSILTVASRQPALEQSRLAEAVGVDRATLAAVVVRLEDRGLIRRSRDKHDQRLKQVSLTSRGEALLARMTLAAGRAHARTLSPLPALEREAFLASLARLVAADDARSKAPLTGKGTRRRKAAV
jgi:DNA-binding MarR family transcriptional regulator